MMEKKNKLCILSNFGPIFHVGGSEEVIKNISLNLSDNYDISIFAHNYTRPFLWNGIKLDRCLKGNYLISKLGDFDHILIYSDSFWELKTILSSLDKIKCKISLVVVGAYFLQSNPKYLKILKDNIDKFNLIAHSEITPDYKWCTDNNLPITVIPNGVNLSEFTGNVINFREKYNIKEKYIILSVSQFFYGKGQEDLGAINRELKKCLDDFIIVQISSSIQYTYEKRFIARAKKNFNSDKCLFLRDLPREDVVAAFNSADILVFPSKKEVAPLVLLEARASQTPWISMAIGNAKDVPGGIIINNPTVDAKGYKVINNKIVNNFAEEIQNILSSQDLRKELKSEGQEDIKGLDWSNIVSEYDRIFNL